MNNPPPTPRKWTLQDNLGDDAYDVVGYGPPIPDESVTAVEDVPCPARWTLIGTANEANPQYVLLDGPSLKPGERIEVTRVGAGPCAEAQAGPQCERCYDTGEVFDYGTFDQICGKTPCLVCAPPDTRS